MVERSAERRAPKLTVAHVALLLPWVIAIIGARLPVRDNSFLWHVRAGSEQLEAGSVLTADPFSFTALGEPWRTQSWLVELVYARLEVAFGLGFVPLMVGASSVVTMALVILTVYRATQSIEATALVGVMTTWLGAAFLNPRPVLFSFLFLAMTIVAVGDRRLRWLLPLLGWIWASVHASFLLGIGYVVLDGLRSKRRQAATDAALMGFTATLGAHGLGVWEIVLGFLGSSEALDLMTEWATPNLISVEFAPFLIGIVLIVVGAIQGRVTARDLWIIVPFLAFSLTAQRAVFPGWIALAPFAGQGMAGIRRSTPASSDRLIGAVGLAILAMPFLIPITGKPFEERFPVDAADHLTSDRVFHDDVVGGYLIYTSGPDRRVFVDDRAELFGADHLRDVVQARNGTPAWRRVFEEWDIEQVLIRSGDGLGDALRDSGWLERHRDEEFVVFDRP